MVEGKACRNVKIRPNPEIMQAEIAIKRFCMVKIAMMLRRIAANKESITSQLTRCFNSVVFVDGKRGLGDCIMPTAFQVLSLYIRAMNRCMRRIII